MSCPATSFRNEWTSWEWTAGMTVSDMSRLWGGEEALNPRSFSSRIISSFNSLREKRIQGKFAIFGDFIAPIRQKALLEDSLPVLHLIAKHGMRPEEMYVIRFDI
ncbi:hypothetical protein TNIN_343241 [Trichonephila inaurata madagascariensis]|uniref:Uncharacterized protein n=1 Tax=Trichonephila inaurata madagascariensis TaxID=2747483 RepID=A0A8X7BZ45_9ARAC|nr:hypothetical protein TNIN_343241 [Trichonephila inaurata madagascariensis]